MDKLLQEIKDLEKKSARLECSEKERDDLLSAVRSFTNKYINNLPEAKSFINKKPNTANLKIGSDLKNINEILSIFRDEVTETGLRAASGGHIGYIPGGGIFPAAIGDFLAAISNEYAGVSYASPGAVAVENEVLNWLKSIFSFPESAVGNLTSGGSIANLIALTAARDKFEIKNEKIKQSVIYLSSQVHHSVNKALRIIGLEDIVVRYLELDSNFRIDSGYLQKRIEEDKANNLKPFLVIASAGTTDVGAIDPLEEIARLTKKYNMWLHVDAAYGGFFVLSSRKAKFIGIEKADSLVVDPHKGMFLPYGTGAVLIKDAKAVLHSNHYMANYMQDALIENLVDDPANVSPELTKHFRGLRIWLPLQLLGIKPFVACLEEKLLLTQYLRNRLLEMGFNVGPEPDLSVSYFWFPFEKDENKFNQKLMELIHKDGSIFFSSTVLNDKFVIRIAILSFRTKLYTIDRAIEMISNCLIQTKNSFL